MISGVCRVLKPTLLFWTWNQGLIGHHFTSTISSNDTMFSTSTNTNGAPFSLKFIVVGGGVAGEPLRDLKCYLYLNLQRPCNRFHAAKGWPQRRGSGEAESEDYGSFFYPGIYSVYNSQSFRVLARRVVVSGEYL